MASGLAGLIPDSTTDVHRLRPRSGRVLNQESGISFKLQA